MNMSFWQFWLGVFSEADGTPSYSRVMSGIFLMFMLTLDIIHYAGTGQLPNFADLVAQGCAGNTPYMINAAKKIFNHQDSHTAPTGRGQGDTKALSSK